MMAIDKEDRFNEKGLYDLLTSTIHKKFRLVRKIYKLSQRDASILLNVGMNTIRRYETGMRSPDLDFLIKFLSTFHVDPQWLFSSSETPFPVSDIAPNGDLDELVFLASIPEIRRGLLAELDKLKTIFEPKIKEFEKKSDSDQRAIIEKRKEGFQSRLKLLKKLKYQPGKTHKKGVLGVKILNGSLKKDKEK